MISEIKKRGNKYEYFTTAHNQHKVNVYIFTTRKKAEQSRAKKINRRK